MPKFKYSEAFKTFFPDFRVLISVENFDGLKSERNTYQFHIFSDTKQMQTSLNFVKFYIMIMI